MRSKEVCEKLGISKMTLHNYVKAGKIKIKARYSKALIIYDDESVYAIANNQLVDDTRKQ